MFLTFGRWSGEYRVDTVDERLFTLKISNKFRAKQSFTYLVDFVQLSRRKDELEGKQ